MTLQLAEHAVDPDIQVIELGGEIDLYTAPEFKERMAGTIDEGKTRVVVDLSQPTFIDSTTLGVLVGGLKRLRPAGGEIVLVCTDEKIVKIFEITGLDRVFPIYATRNEALALRPRAARSTALDRRGPSHEMTERTGIGGPTTNLRCANCGQSFYSDAYREVLARRVRCPACGGRLAPKPETELETTAAALSGAAEARDRIDSSRRAARG
jgi:anti-sigma B factor antagonist